MEILLKIKGLYQYTKVVIPYTSNTSTNLVVDGMKNEVFGVISTYISWEIWFHTSGIDCLHEVWKKVKYLFHKVDRSWVMQIEKELISLDPHSFEWIEDYLSYIKELQLKLGECGKGFPKKDG